jgi:hypothetical protein
MPAQGRGALVSNASGWRSRSVDQPDHKRRLNRAVVAQHLANHSPVSGPESVPPPTLFSVGVHVWVDLIRKIMKKMINLQISEIPHAKAGWRHGDRRTDETD